MCEYVGPRSGKTCVVQRAENIHNSKNYCNNHYKRLIAIKQSTTVTTKKVINTDPILLDKNEDPLINKAITTVIKDLRTINAPIITIKTNKPTHQPVEVKSNEQMHECFFKGMKYLEMGTTIFLHKYTGLSIIGTTDIMRSLDPENKILSKMNPLTLINIDESKPLTSFLKILMASLIMSLFANGVSKLANRPPPETKPPPKEKLSEMKPPPKIDIKKAAAEFEKENNL